MSDNPKILIVGGFPNIRKSPIYGGQVTACRSLLSSSLIHDYNIITFDTTQISNPPPPLLLRFFLSLVRLFTFTIILVLRRPRAVILFFGSGASAVEKSVLSSLSQFLGAKSIVFPRAGELVNFFNQHKLLSRFFKSTLGTSDYALVQGSHMKRFFLEELNYDAQNLFIVPNWTASENHIHIGRQRDYSSLDTLPRLLFLGWLEPFKGVYELLESVKTLANEGLQFHVTFAGNGSSMSHSLQFVRDYSLSSKVTFAGWSNVEVKNQLLHDSNIFVLPSWNEGLPNSMIEAMCSGLACVLSDVGAISDHIDPFETGLLTKPRDATSLCSALRLLIQSPSLRNRLGHSASLYAKHAFSLEKGTKLISEVISKSLS